MKSPSRLFATCLATACLGAGLAASAAQAASPAWAPLAHSGPTNLAPVQDEIQRLSVDAEGGTYKLTRQAATGAGTLSFGSSNFATWGSADTTIEAFGASGFAVGQTIFGTGIPSGTTIVAVAPGAGFFSPTILTISTPTTAASGGFVAITAASKEVTGVTTSSGAFAAGQLISADGIPAASGEGDLASGSAIVSNVSTTTGAFAVGERIAGAGVPAGTTITEVGTGTLTLSAAAVASGTDVLLTANTTITAVGAGTLTLSAFPTKRGAKALTATATTDAIDFNAAASAVGTAIEAGLGLEVSVKGGPGGKGGTNPYFVSFEGDLAGKDVPELSADSGELTGGDNHTATLTTALDGGPGTGEVVIYAQNVGGVPSSGTTRVAFTLPEGVKTAAKPGTGGWSCPGGAGEDGMTCTHTPHPLFGPLPAEPGFPLSRLVVPIVATQSAQSGHVNIKVWGGGAEESTEETAATFDMPLIVSSIPAPIGLQAFNAGAYKDTGEIDTRAGAHPYSAASGFLVNTVRSSLTGEILPAGEARDIFVDTPPGFIGNPIATPQCPEALEQSECPRESIVATAKVPVGKFAAGGEFQSNPVNNIEAPFGFPAKFRFIADVFGQVTINVVASLRSDEDYGLEVGSYNTPQIKPVFGAFFTIWGSPFDEGHDKQRCSSFNNVGIGQDCLTHDEIIDAGHKPVAFLTNPVDCAEEAARAPVATVNVNTWQAPELLFAGKVALEPVTGCEQLDFEVEDFAFEPDTDDADSPASFETELRMPTGGLIDPDKRMNPTIKQTVVELPEGVVLNASAADGLKACSEEEIGLIGTNEPRPNEIRFNKDPNSCPDASKIGSGELKSALLANPLQADLFLAEQGEGNPFGSLFAIYLVIEDPRTGIFIKLPGEVQVDDDDGQQKIVFKDLPPLPFTYLKLNLKGGDRSPLATPTTCGDYTTTATNTPWSAPESGPPLTSRSEFDIDDGPAGGCADSESGRPFAPGLAAGSDLLQAGAHTPLRFRVTRPDGHQELDTLRFDLPQGLAAKLKGVPLCPEPLIAQAISRDSGEDEQDNPSCPAVSQVGRTLAGAGSGPAPFYAPGKLYLAGPYKGQPLSVVAITPAVAGPFDLGNVVVRNAIAVNPVTAQVTALSDEIPKVHEGIPLRVKDIRVILDRPGFALNPTSCAQKLIGAQLTGSHGAVSTLASRFQVGNCAALGFEPKTRVQLFGGVKRGKYQGVRAVVRPRPGDSNISRTVVRFPRSAFVAQEHLKNICTRVQFAAEACPPSSIYGKAVAWSPLLDMPLRGNVHLRSSDNVLPDLVADLRGPAHQPIKVEVAIRNDSVKGALRNTVQTVPDAPVSYFRLQTFGGDKGLIVNSRNICGRNQARVVMNAHNGRRSVETVNVFNRRCKALKRKQRAKRRQAKQRMQRAKARAAVARASARHG